MRRSGGRELLSGYCSTARLVEEGRLPLREGDPASLRAKCPIVFIDGRRCADPSHEGVEIETCKACHAVRSPDEIDQVFGRCIDVEECTENLREWLAGHPTYRMLQEVKEMAEQVREEEYGAKIERQKATRPDLITPGRCEHCGAETKSRFAPGHDAKLKSVLLRLGREGDPEAAAELVLRNWIETFDTLRLDEITEYVAEGILEDTGRDVWLRERVVARLARIDAGTEVEDAIRSKERVGG